MFNWLVKLSSIGNGFIKTRHNYRKPFFTPHIYWKRTIFFKNLRTYKTLKDLESQKLFSNKHLYQISVTFLFLEIYKQKI